MTHNILDQLDRRRHFERGNGNDISMYGRGKKENIGIFQNTTKLETFMKSGRMERG